MIDSTGAAFNVFYQLLSQGKEVVVNGAETQRGFVTQEQVIGSLGACLASAKGGEVFVLMPRVVKIAEMAAALRAIVGRGEVRVKETTGLGWEKESATLIMAEELAAARRLHLAADVDIITLDMLKRHSEAEPVFANRKSALTLEDCEHLGGNELSQFLSNVIDHHSNM